ncbi:dimethyl sulfoxide reductase anchor subunit family protein [Desulfitobacterium sp. AusDCA]|uniref:dimethyl sulfoxide reductase anchor subunit family protein n=1 Tax=Desulfitobacterium sp. AusDCA TaxID=3240383 RepID=UPI003DA72FCE
MFAEEWPLMMFTLFSQLAIGSFVMLLLVRTLMNKKEGAGADKLTQFGLQNVGWVMAFALVLSLFHLGTPTGAYRSIYHLASSWLSREILTAGGFFVFWFATRYTLKKGHSANALGWVAAIFGLAAIYSMASIYATSIRPAWTNVNTYVAFYGATLAMGTAGALSFMAFGAKGSQISAETLGLLKKISLLAGVCVLIQLLDLPILISSLNNGGTAAAQASAKLLSGSYLVPLIIRVIISIIGAVLLFLGFSHTGNEGKTMFSQKIYVALLLLFVGEFVARYIFYGTAVSIMIGAN